MSFSPAMRVATAGAASSESERGSSNMAERRNGLSGDLSIAAGMSVSASRLKAGVSPLPAIVAEPPPAKPPAHERFRPTRQSHAAAWPNVTAFACRYFEIFNVQLGAPFCETRR